MSRDPKVHDALPVPHDPSSLPVVRDPGDLPPAMRSILEKALDKNVPAGEIEKLVMLAERMTDRAAASEFNAAMSAFQAECPQIKKTSIAKIATSGGGGYSYHYADLEQIVKVIQPYLTARGLSIGWDTNVSDRLMKATCTVRHVNGHKESANFSCPTETKAGMSEQQKYGSSMKYAMRQALILVLGLTTCDPDTPDAPPPGALEKITESEVADLEAMIQEVKANRAIFIKWLQATHGVSRLEDITRHSYPSVVRALDQKRRKP